MTISNDKLSPQTPPDIGSIEHQPALKCYQVGDHDYVAASSPEEALEVLRVIDTTCDPDDYDVELCSDAVLDARWTDEEKPGEDAGSLREWLAEAKQPQWLNGTE